MNFYGINDKDRPLYQSYVDNRYFSTAIQNDSGKSNKVSSWAKFRHGVPRGCVLGLLLFLLYIINFIIDLPKITNITSAPIIFADDTSILFAHSDLIDFNKHIHRVFVTLNKWFKANQLLQNFNKTNYIHPATKRNMLFNLKIGFNNNLITRSSYTKFLDITLLCLGITIFIREKTANSLLYKQNICLPWH